MLVGGEGLPVGQASPRYREVQCQAKSKALSQADWGSRTRAIRPHQIPPNLSVSSCKIDLKKTYISELW